MFGYFKKALKINQVIESISDFIKDNHIRLAVTGLSRSGKSAFITSLISQIENHEINASHPDFGKLKLFSNYKIVDYQRLERKYDHVAEFPYEEAISNVASNPPKFPLPTRSISQLCLQVDLQHRFDARKKNKLVIEIFDYPGEWLLDLNMLNMEYLEWSEQQFNLMKDSPERLELASNFLHALTEIINGTKEVNETNIDYVVKTYTEYLFECKNKGYQIIQPGQFVQQENQSLCNFFPCLSFFQLSSVIKDFNQQDNFHSSGLQKIMEDRYKDYIDNFVAVFYDKFFKHFDRQIVIFDGLSPLNHSRDALAETSLAIFNIIKRHYKYGKRSLYNRLFNPTIDKLVIAPSKADLIVSDQQVNYYKLLENCISSLNFTYGKEGKANSKIIPFAAIRATEQIKVTDQNNNVLTLLKGRIDQAPDYPEKVLDTGFVPDQLPHRDHWQKYQHKIPQFIPLQPPMYKGTTYIKSIGMAEIMQFLIDDKL